MKQIGRSNYPADKGKQLVLLFHSFQLRNVTTAI